jgi:uncharacterized membrane protein required for colicin V production
MNTLDIILLAIIGLFALWGFSKGFVSTIVGLVGYVAAFIAARIWGNQIGETLKGTGVMESLERSINSNLANMGFSGMDPEATTQILNDTEFGALITRNPIYQNLMSESNSIGAAAEGVTAVIVNIISVALGFLLVFLAVKLVISLIGAAISGLAKMSKPLGFVNRFFGLISGSVIGISLAVIGVVFVVPIIMTYNTDLYNLAQSSILSGILLQIANVFI